ncbi:hypothetical protein ABGN05_04035 [Aquibium sp. LZ166]|uniref:VCBS repeat-containing protein n=1 Tax=Aquibium pacificus TaxID=3153579 RepID=A0ABV3SET6_9HYPH
MRFFLCVLVVFGLSAPALAQSKAAKYLIDQEVSKACEGPGTIRPESAIERDITGDGRDDLIINHRGIWCGSSQSGFCGMQLCDVLIYVRKGSLLHLELETMSGSLRLSDENPPDIYLSSHGGDEVPIKWDGNKFR